MGDKQQKIMEKIQQKQGIFTKHAYVTFHEEEYPKI
jgi:hypothetical protein